MTADVIRDPTNFTDLTSATAQLVRAARDVVAAVLERREDGPAIRRLLDAGDLSATVSVGDLRNQAVVSLEDSKGMNVLVIGWAWLPEPITIPAAEDTAIHARGTDT